MKRKGHVWTEVLAVDDNIWHSSLIIRVLKEYVFNEYKKGIILKALDEKGKIIGSVRGYLEDGTVYIGKLMVHPQDQGKVKRNPNLWRS